MKHNMDRKPKPPLHSGQGKCQGHREISSLTQHHSRLKPGSASNTCNAVGQKDSFLQRSSKRGCVCSRLDFPTVPSFLCNLPPLSLLPHNAAGRHLECLICCQSIVPASICLYNHQPFTETIKTRRKDGSK